MGERAFPGSATLASPKSEAADLQGKCNTRRRSYQALAQQRRAPLSQGPSSRLSSVDALLVTPPPVRAVGDPGAPQQPRAIVAIGIDIGTIDPDPCTVSPHPMTVEVASIVVAIATRGATLIAISPIVSVDAPVASCSRPAIIAAAVTSNSRPIVIEAASSRPGTVAPTTPGAGTIAPITSGAGTITTTSAAPSVATTTAGAAAITSTAAPSVATATAGAAATAAAAPAATAPAAHTAGATLACEFDEARTAVGCGIEGGRRCRAGHASGQNEAAGESRHCFQLSLHHEPPFVHVQLPTQAPGVTPWGNAVSTARFRSALPQRDANSRAASAG
jgi:hypothetical protein